MNRFPKIKNIESLQKYLEHRFMIKLITILKQTDLNTNQQYNIAKIFKHNYTQKLIELTDEPKINKDEIMKNLRSTFYLVEDKIETPATYRMIDLVCEEHYKILRRQIQEENNIYTNRFELYDDEINLYNEFY